MSETNKKFDVKRKPRNLPLFSFVNIQLFWYILSSIGLSYYFLHWFTNRSYASKDIFHIKYKERVTNHALWELFILFGRSINEILSNKIGFGDYLHHLVMLVGTLMVVYGPIAFLNNGGYLLCQMQILHIPLAIWYSGIRRDSVFGTQNFLCALMRPLWLFSAGYRATLMFAGCVKILTFIGKNYDWKFNLHEIIRGEIEDFEITTAITVAVFGVILFHLDVGWTKYFLSGSGGKPRGAFMLMALFLGSFWAIMTTWVL